jgi:iron complex transport system permease protein
MKTSSAMAEMPLLPLPRVPCMVWFALAVLLVLAFALELALGSMRIPLHAVTDILLGSRDVPEGWRQIVLLFRLPRAIAALLAGAALGIAGLKMQTLFRNPLAEPFVLGISSGASLGVALVVLAADSLNLSAMLAKGGVAGTLSTILAATLGALVVLSFVLAVARRVESALTLLIVGLMFGYIANSLVNILMQFAAEHPMHNYINWTFGSFGSVTWKQMMVFAPAVMAGAGGAWFLAKPLNALLLGETYAQSMGIPVLRIRTLVIAGAAVLAGSVTAFCGPIGFVGIAVPHLCRMLLKTSDHRILVPATVLLGGALALFADLIAQVPGSRITLPLNAITALIGAPVVVGVILRRRNRMEEIA